MAVGYALGAIVGSLGAFVIGGFIVGVSPIDPLTLAIAGILIVATAAAASALPAWRAAHVDPLLALRAQ